jgi:hypothetical protein
MHSDFDDDPPSSHAIAEGWAEFSEKVLPTLGGTGAAQAHMAFYFGALHVLQIVDQIAESGSADAAALALSILTIELNEFIKAHSITTQ